ncbi:MAG: hypothetical protein NZ888_07595, partial [Candidatus Nitrosocaldus sp.]|nr:hypothetical protein [Candidatus Nitrosocaldus sp.]
MMRKALLLITVGIASAAILIAISVISGLYNNNQISYSGGSSSSNNTSTINDIDSKYRFIPINESANVRGYISSQLHAYLTWDELVKEHDTIIVGEVVEVRGSLVRKSEVMYEGQKVEYGIPYTYSDIIVEKVLKGTNIKEGDTIIVKQTGGMLDEENIALSDSDVILKEGERYVMFLLGPAELEWAKGLIVYG